MNISSAYSLAQTQFVTELEPDNRRKTRTESGSHGDTVSFSDEAMALASAMARGDTAEQGGQSSAFERNPGGDAAQEEASKQAEGAAGGGAGASSSDTGDIDAQIKKLAAQIQQLAQQMNAVMSGSGSEEEKTIRSVPLQERINGLEQQMEELLAQKRAQQQNAQNAQNA